MKENRECEVCRRKVKTVHFRVKYSKVLCEPHYRQMVKYGKIIREKVSGELLFKKTNKIKNYRDYSTIEIPYREEMFHIKIDKNDVEKCKKFHWFINEHKTVSANLKIKKGKFKTIFLNRFLMDDPKNYMVKHIGKDLLDFRKKNLILIPASKPNIFSGKGISWASDLQKWQLGIYCGKYKDLEEAKKLRDYMFEKLEDYRIGVKQ